MVIMYTRPPAATEHKIQMILTWLASKLLKTWTINPNKIRVDVTEKEINKGQKKRGRQPMVSSSVSLSAISAWGGESGCQYNFPHAGQVKSFSSKGPSQ